MDDAALYLLRQNIASMLDHPSVYMGGPSRGSVAKAIRIIQALQDQWKIEPTDKVSGDIARVKEWRTSPWDSFDRV